MSETKKLESIAHFTSYLPRPCGIATYEAAIHKTVKDRLPDLKEIVVALDDIEGGYKYSNIVKYHFHDKDKASYIKAAQIINDSDAQVVNIQHEFGLYGASVNPSTLGQDDGQNFLLFLRELKKPVVTTMHMVYKEPNEHHAAVVKEICDRSFKIVVLSRVAKDLLVEKYGIEAAKIAVIPHGAPNVPRYATGFFKEMLGFSKKDFIISSFGLIRPKKGYEYLIDSMVEVVKKEPRSKLLIIGRYHPLRSPGYYKMLKDRVKELKLTDNVKFINKFVNYTDLLNYLMATNVFVAPFLVMDQVSSGSLIYAMAAGRACIATPFDYAREVLDDNRGIIVPPEDSHAIAEEIIHLLDHPKARHHFQNLSYKYARPQIWSRTAKNYIQIFTEALNSK